MFKVKKKITAAKEVAAYRLGEEQEVLKCLMDEGKLVEKAPGVFEVFSREAVNGTGEIAYAGDYIKVDVSGNPYCNTAEFFEKNHIKTGENQYRQIPAVCDAWTAQEEMCEEIRYLIREKGLALDEASEEKYYTAPLFGTMESAGRDAVLVFYRIDRGEQGEIQDADFNFVARDIFDAAYDIIG